MLPFLQFQDPVTVPFRPDLHFRLLREFTGMLMMAFHHAILHASLEHRVYPADHLNTVAPEHASRILRMLNDVQDFVNTRRSRDSEVSSYIVTANMFAERLTFTVGHHDGSMRQIVFTGYNPTWMQELRTKLETGGNYHKHAHLRETFANMRRHISVTHVFPEPVKQAA